MKKILSLVLALTLFVVAMPISAFADTTSADSLFGVIIDAEGNIVERLPMPKTTYVDSIINIPAGGAYVSYRYEADDFFFLACRTYDANGVTITKPGFSFHEQIEYSSTLNGIRGDLGGFGSPFSDDLNPKGITSAVEVKGIHLKDGVVPYFSARVDNNSSTANKVRIIIAVDDRTIPD